MTELPLIIGGETVSMPAVMNFATLKAAWPAIRRLGESQDPIERMGAAIEVIAAALARVRPDLTEAEIEARATVAEMPALVAALPLLMTASGFTPAEAGTVGESSMAASTP
jgi:hypothetical protein